MTGARDKTLEYEAKVDEYMRTHKGSVMIMMPMSQNDLKPYGAKRNIWTARVDDGVVVSYDRSGAQCACSKRPTDEQVQALADELTAEDFVPGMKTTYTMEFAETKKGTWEVISCQI